MHERDVIDDHLLVEWIGSSVRLKLRINRMLLEGGTREGLKCFTTSEVLLDRILKELDMLKSMDEMRADLTKNKMMVELLNR